MTTVGEGLPEGRYRRSASDQARTDRRLKAVGAVLGAALLAFVGWAGYSYISGASVSGELTGFTIISDTEVELTLTVHKPASAIGVCTVRSQAPDGLEVGRADFRFEEDNEDFRRSVTLRTTARATSAELVGCAEAADTD